MRRRIVFLVLLSLPFAAHGQDRRCSDDAGNDRCEATAIATQNRLFGLPSVADLVADGTQVRRAIFVDGYGRDLLAISFIRPRGREPMVELRRPRQPELTSLAPLDPRIWQRSIDAGTVFDRELVPLPAPADDSIAICLHAWSMRAEAGDPVRQRFNGIRMVDIPAVTRSRVQGGCAEGLASAYAFALADLAIEALPLCQLIDPAQQRNNVTRLSACMSFSGDRAAAANVYNAAKTWLNLTGDVRQPNFSAGRWPLLFAGNARFDLAGSEPSPTGDAASRLLDWLKGQRHSQFGLYRFDGIDADTVIATGEVVRNLASDEATEVADLQVRWTLSNGDAVIETVAIGMFRRLADD